MSLHSTPEDGEPRDGGWASATLVRAPARPPGWRRRLRRGGAFAFTTFLGALFTQSLVGALLVAGWLQRWTDRAVLRAWWRRSPVALMPFEDFCAESADREDAAEPPRWVLERRRWPSPRRGGLADRWWRGFGRNLTLGLRSLANVAALTLPGAALMALGWWGGWQNSFHKGYEEFHVGPLTVWIGILLLTAAFLYLPMALARQAATGRWQAFWEIGLVRRLISQSWAAYAALAVATAALNVGILGFKTWPYFLPQVQESTTPAPRGELVLASGHLPADGGAAMSELRTPPMQVSASRFEDLTADEALGLLNRHYLFGGLYLFVALVALRAAAGLVYAGALLRGIQRGVIAEVECSEREWKILQRLGLIVPQEETRRAWPVRVAAWAATRLGRTLCIGIALLATLSLPLGNVIAEFLNRHPWIGFLNQPLVQVPWFRHVPVALESPAGNVLSLVLVLLGIGAVAGWRNWRKGRARARG